MINTILTIAIPTFNREVKLRSQLTCILNLIEINELKINLEILIANNASTDNTSELLADFKKRYSFIEVINHQKNIGFVNNYKFLINKAKGEFIWVVGDDDPLNSNVLDTIYNAIIKNVDPELGVVHLNHACKLWSGEIYHEEYYSGLKTMINEDGKAAFYSLSNNHGIGGLMFITASVFKSEYAREAIYYWKGKSNNQAFPLFVFGYVASKRKVSYMSEISIDCIFGDSFWSNNAQEIFLFQVNEILINLMRLGYNKIHIKKLMNNNIKSHISRKQILNLLLKKPYDFFRLSYFLIRCKI
jgi:glycosyltransferase involved in cell wall biosynthesis